jgi:hypothetical protein
MREKRRAVLVSGATLLAGLALAGEGFVDLFNGKDLAGWKVPAGDNGHWKAADGVIDYDARSEAPGDKSLWTEKEYGDFVLEIDWRLKATPGVYPMADILPDGSTRQDAEGKEILTERPNADSGVFLRGTTKAQVNIWCWPVGSGEVWGYRTDPSMPPEVRAGAVPKVRADKPVGEWNHFQITMKGDRLSVKLNDQVVIDSLRLPGVPVRGAIGLQHHGGFANGKYEGASSVVQFRNVSIKEL